MLRSDQGCQRAKSGFTTVDSHGQSIMYLLDTQSHDLDSRQVSQEHPASISRPSTPQQRIKPTPGSRPTTPGSRPPATAHAHALHPKQPVQTPQQFYDWFALIDRSVAHSQEAHFRQHLLRVSEHLDMCDRLVGRIDQVDSEVLSMLEKWRGVEEGGKSL